MSNDKILFTYYSLYECTNKDKVIKKLRTLCDEDKIVFEITENNETFKIEDIELSDKEIDGLIDMFDKNDVIPDMDKTESDSDDDLSSEDTDDWDDNW